MTLRLDFFQSSSRRSRAALTILALLFVPIVASGQACPAQNSEINDRANAGANTAERLDTQTQGSPIYNQFNFNNGPTPGTNAHDGTAIAQAIASGLTGDALTQFVNKVKTVGPDGVPYEVSSPGQIYKQDSNSFTFTITSGGTTPTATGGGASGAATASTSTTQTPTQTAEAKPVLTLPVTLAVGAAPIAQGAPASAVGEGGAGGTQSNTADATARAEFLQAENEALKKLIAERIANQVTPDATETSTK
ncbi:MAG: hypothetical protein H6819_06795 [Phycisphaerales bacterium]|nr:hypothetical protein [Phycisphaerales bacterium]MCB9855289.1 hypothetical protein [Phycisphaerales bacterium]MCB9862882.1 hypothetical protein [Phycisphaerales bacterium]